MERTYKRARSFVFCVKSTIFILPTYYRFSLISFNNTLMKRLLFLLLGIGLFASSFAQTSSYEASIKAWQQQRLADLKTEDGWLNLAGLFWLKEGENSIGSDAHNDLIFPEEHSAGFIGKILLQKGKVTFVPTTQTPVQHQAQVLTTPLTIFPYEKNPIVLAHQSLRWFVIQRGDKYAVRLRDLESPFLKTFHGIPTFLVDSTWRIKAKFVPTAGRKITVLDITGRTYLQESLGKLVFTIAGIEYALETTGTMKHLFIVFGDASNQRETYGGGRFLEVEEPDAQGFTYLDFNKAYNPPCAFTPFATCPLPTKENKLSLYITAGEKRYGEH